MIKGWARLLSVVLSVFVIQPVELIADEIDSLSSTQAFQVYHAHPYPVCFYDTNLGAVSAAENLWRSYPETLRDVIDLKARRQTAFAIVSSRMVVVRTTLNHHRELLDVWPEVACVGRTDGSETNAINRICRSYVADFLESQFNHTTISDESLEFAPTCQTFFPETE